MYQKIEYLKQNLNFVFSQILVFHRLKIFQDRIPGEKIRKVLLTSIVRSYLLNLAMLLDPVEDGKGNKNITIRLIASPDNKYEPTVRKITTVRHKILAHNDVDALQDLDALLYKLNLKHEETEELTEHLIEIVEKHTETRFPREQIFKECQEQVDRLLALGE